MDLPEKDWQRQVIDLAQLCGWRVAHFRPARTEHGWRTPVEADGAGFPDLVLVRDGVVIFAELKADRGRVSDAQEAWIEALSKVDDEAFGHVRTFVWRPADFDEVRAELAPVPAVRSRPGH